METGMMVCICVLFRVSKKESFSDSIRVVSSAAITSSHRFSSPCTALACCQPASDVTNLSFSPAWPSISSPRWDFTTGRSL